MKRKIKVIFIPTTLCTSSARDSTPSTSLVSNVEEKQVSKDQGFSAYLSMKWKAYMPE